MIRRRQVVPNGYEAVPEAPQKGQSQSGSSKGGNANRKGKEYTSTDMRTPFVCGVGYEVRSVASVDCVAQEFFADVSIFMKWYDEANKCCDVGELEAETLAHKPHIIISNVVAVKVRFQTYVKLASDPPGVVHCETVYTGRFREFMELEQFPLDQQDLSVSFRFVDARWAVRLLTQPKFRTITDDVELAEWFMFEPHVKIGRISGGTATFTLKMKVFRKFQYYLSNVIGMMGGITTLAFFSFLFEPTMWEQKSTYIATLLLTSVAFKFVVDGSLPKVSFTTILDLYMLVAFGIMVTVLVQAGIIKGLQRTGLASDETIHSLNTTLGFILVFGWFIWNIGYFWRFFQFEQEQRDRLGELLPQIITNKESPGSCASFLFCQKDEDSDSDQGSDSGSDRDLLEQKLLSADMLSCCTALDIATPKGVVNLMDQEDATVVTPLAEQGAMKLPGPPAGWVLDERGLLRPEIPAEMEDGIEPASPHSPTASSVMPLRPSQMQMRNLLSPPPVSSASYHTQRVPSSNGFSQVTRLPQQLSPALTLPRAESNLAERAANVL